MGNLCWGCLIAAGRSLHGGVTRDLAVSSTLSHSASWATLSHSTFSSLSGVSCAADVRWNAVPRDVFAAGPDSLNCNAAVTAEIHDGYRLMAREI